MISIIICSVNPVMLAALKENVAATIGVPYEIIAIDNTNNRYSICAAYNKGGAEAAFPVLCFMHEDISFDTLNWGKLVCRHLENKKTGLLAVAGGDAKSWVPSSWSVPVVSNEINLVQHYKKKGGSTEKLMVTANPGGSPLKKAIAADGVWLCTRKEVFNKFAFDEQLLKGFHGYDIDYCLQVNTRYDVYVVFDILIHHYSEGTPGKEWVNSAILISRKWKKRLPLYSGEIAAEKKSWHHWHSLRTYLGHLFRLQYKPAFIIGSYLRYSFSPYFSFRRFLSLGKFVVSGIVNGRSSKNN